MLFRRSNTRSRQKQTSFILVALLLTAVILMASPASRTSFTSTLNLGIAQDPTNGKSNPKDNSRLRNGPEALTQISFTAAADSYVSSAATTTNFGTATDLRSKRSNLESYLRFDLGSILNESVVSAKLRLTGNISDTSATNLVAQVFSVSNTTWSETGIQWSNKPSSGSSALASATIANDVAALYEWDVTAFVKSEIAAERHLISLALKNQANSTPFVTFNSRESLSGQPELLVTSTMPPVVSITSPVAGSSFLAPGSITIDAAASDADGIAKVEFLQGSTVLTTDTEFPYSFTWNNVAIGNYNLTARATDAVGGIKTSAPVNVSVVATFPPTVSITSPLTGTSFAAPATITIDVDATDSDGVQKVDFYQGNTLIGTDDTFPYSLTWTGMPACAYFLTAKATDTLGATGTSAPVTIKVTTTSLGEPTPPNFKIAFVGDQGLGPLSAATLTLIASEGAQALVIPGDLDYADNPAAWEAQLNSTVGADFPVFTLAGNHDEDIWHGPNGYQRLIEARYNRLGIPWCGSCGIQQSFHYKGIFFVFTTPGLDPIVDLGNNAAYIREQLAADRAVWSIASWHKNMHLMQAGGKDDEAGWEVYEESRAGGAIIANAHEHSYFRTHLLSSMMNQTVASTSSTMTLTKGNSFVFVSGLGGQSRRDQEVTGPWVARIYATPCLPGDPVCVPNAVEGAMFAIFNVDGQQNKANFYFKDVNGQIIDSFTVISQVDMPVIESISPTETPAGGPGVTLSITGSGFINESRLHINGNPRPTSFLSDTQLIAQLSAEDIQNPGVFPVKIVNGVTGGGISNEINFTVIAQPNPVPTLTSVEPGTALLGGPNVTVTLIGTNFLASSIARLNGQNLVTTFISDTQLTADIPTTEMNAGGTFPITVFNQPPAGGESNALDIIVQNPVPVLASLSPGSKIVGDQAFTLTVTGTGFVNGSVIKWNGSDRTTTFVSKTSLTTEITAADLVTSGEFAVTVFNPAPNGGVSNSVNFTVNNPLPVLDSVSPTLKLVGDASFTLSVSGSGFVSGSSVRWNGTDRPTTFVNGNSLTAEIPTTDLNFAGTFPVTVFNPLPGGGTSASGNITVDNPLPMLESLSPNNKTVGDGPFIITVNGSGFSSDSVVRWNGEDRSTIFMSGTMLTAEILDSDLLVAGIVPITVFTTTPGGGLSNQISFTVNNPISELTSLSPSSIVVGSPGFTLTVNGHNFFDGVVVRWNGSDRPTQFINSTQLTAQITAADVQNVGVATVVVFVPPPGGGLTPAIEFAINNLGYEGDVAPRPNGSNNGTLTIADWVQVGRFASGLDIPSCDEFQRADVAPRDTKGGGTITVADWVQAGRFASGLDPVVPTGGPGCPQAAPQGSNQAKVERAVTDSLTRLVRIGSTSIQQGETATVTITLDAQGNENALGLSLNFVPTQLSFVSAEGGEDAADAMLMVNSDQAASGNLELNLALPPGKRFTRGTRQVVVLRFRALLGNELPVIGFADKVNKLSVVDDKAEELAASFAPLLPGDSAKISNPIDEARFFVNQNYLDFLGRAPETAGLDYWTIQIAGCGPDQACIQNRRVDISAAFFIEQEFQQTGYSVHRFHKAAFGRAPSYAQFQRDRNALAGAVVPLDLAAFAGQFIARPEFQRTYPEGVSAEAFVNRLFDNAGLVESARERLEAIASLTSGRKTRAGILLELVDSQSFKEREYNSAFVLMQYFGYLKRDPDQAGYDFWVNVLNNREPGNYRGMVCSFITSAEYQRRFGAMVTRSNSDCSQ